MNGRHVRRQSGAHALSRARENALGIYAHRDLAGSATLGAKWSRSLCRSVSLLTLTCEMLDATLQIETTEDSLRFFRAGP